MTDDLSSILEKSMWAWRDAMEPAGLNDEHGIVRLPGAVPLSQCDVEGACLYAGRLEYLDAMPKGGTVAEIGVWKGDYSAEILGRQQPDQLHLVDLDLNRYSIADRFAGNGNVHCHEGHSVDVLRSFPPEHFDWIYIDAGHAYEDVRADADAAATRLKPNGRLVFNDYIVWSYTEARLYGVVQTVNEMCRNEGWRIVAFCLHPGMYCDVAIARR